MKKLAILGKLKNQPSKSLKCNGEHMYYRGYWEGISYVLSELQQFTLRQDFFPDEEEN